MQQKWDECLENLICCFINTVLLRNLSTNNKKTRLKDIKFIIYINRPVRFSECFTKLTVPAADYCSCTKKITVLTKKIGEINFSDESRETETEFKRKNEKSRDQRRIVYDKLFFPSKFLLLDISGPVSFHKCNFTIRFGPISATYTVPSSAAAKSWGLFKPYNNWECIMRILI